MISKMMSKKAQISMTFSKLANSTKTALKSQHFEAFALLFMMLMILAMTTVSILS